MDRLQATSKNSPFPTRPRVTVTGYGDTLLNPQTLPNHSLITALRPADPLNGDTEYRVHGRRSERRGSWPVFYFPTRPAPLSLSSALSNREFPTPLARTLGVARGCISSTKPSRRRRKRLHRQRHYAVCAAFDLAA